jgi:hypothetical protein
MDSEEGLLSETWSHRGETKEQSPPPDRPSFSDHYPFILPLHALYSLSIALLTLRPSQLEH